jgi:hypothetical protein
VSLEEHFERKEASRNFFDHLLNEVTSEVGRCEVVSLPCCIHLHGEHDFLAVLPKKDRLEIRFTLPRELKNPRVRRVRSDQQDLVQAQRRHLCDRGDRRGVSRLAA